MRDWLEVVLWALILVLLMGLALFIYTEAEHRSHSQIEGRP